MYDLVSTFAVACYTVNDSIVDFDRLVEDYNYWDWDKLLKETTIETFEPFSCDYGWPIGISLSNVINV